MFFGRADGEEIALLQAAAGLEAAKVPLDDRQVIVAQLDFDFFGHMLTDSASLTLRMETHPRQPKHVRFARIFIDTIGLHEEWPTLSLVLADDREMFDNNRQVLCFR